MLKCASVHTYEIDDPEIAFEEIKSQLDEKITLLANTVGIVMCHPEFVGCGTLKYVCENLPFDTAGVTTSSQAVNDTAGELVLTIFVMTSDDVSFITSVTGDIEESVESAINAAYERIAESIPETPKLALLFPTVFAAHAGDDYVNAWQALLPKTPSFGTFAMDDTPNFDESESIYNGDGYKNAMSFVLCCGDINPRFIVGTVPEENVMPYTGEVTKSNGACVSEINNLNTYKYFESIGFENNGASAVNYLFLPFAVNQKQRADYDGIPVIRVLMTFTEDGSAIFRGNVDEGSTFTLLKCEPEDVLTTTRKKVEEINRLPDVNGVLLFSCIVRRIVSMRENPLMELETAREAMDADIPFMMGYAGGEICPTDVRDGVPSNRYHNYSLAILVL